MQGANFIGDTTDTNINTLGCRAHYVIAIMANHALNTTQCAYTSLTGGGMCGNATDRCATYCAIDIANCPDTWTAPGVTGGGVNGNTPNVSICAQACLSGYGYNQTGSEFNPYDTTGDTVECRTYHALAAGVLGYPHCAHATPLGGKQCGSADIYTNFCSDLYGVCDVYATLTVGQSYFPYDSIADCIGNATTYDTTILGMQWGPVNATSGNNLGCRTYHGGMPSLLLPATHCTHAGLYTAPCNNPAPSPTPAPTTAAPTKSSASTLTAILVVLVAILSFLF